MTLGCSTPSPSLPFSAPASSFYPNLPWQGLQTEMNGALFLSSLWPMERHKLEPGTAVTWRGAHGEQGCFNHPSCLQGHWKAAGTPSSWWGPSGLQGVGGCGHSCCPPQCAGQTHLQSPPWSQPEGQETFPEGDNSLQNNLGFLKANKSAVF